MSTAVQRFPNDHEFAPEQLHAMGEAYDLACLALPNVVDHEAIARAILRAAHGGEASADKLYEIALDGVVAQYQRRG